MVLFDQGKQFIVKTIAIIGNRDKKPVKQRGFRFSQIINIKLPGRAGNEKFIDLFHINLGFWV
jgi:hypothetical protein